MAVKRASALVCYWQDGDFVVENYHDHAVVALDPFAAALLTMLSDWTDPVDVPGAFPDYDPQSVLDALDELRKHGLLLSAEPDDIATPEPAENRVGTAWPAWGPAARYFHYSTRDVPHAKDDTPDSRAELVASLGGTLPALTKRYPDAPRILLPRPHLPGGTAPYFDVLYRRRTTRAFHDRPVPLNDLATLLAAVFGPVAFLDADAFGTLMQRTSPSGGARHEIEAYVLVRAVDGAQPGIYHYQPIEHSLEWLGCPPDHWAALTDLAVGQSGIGEAAFAIVLTAVVDRIHFKYRGARAYRIMLLNAGHLGQTFALTATAIGLGPFQTGAFTDSALERLLGVDGVDETVLYLLGAGWPAPPTGPHDPRFIPSATTPVPVRLY